MAKLPLIKSARRLAGILTLCAATLPAAVITLQQGINGYTGTADTTLFQDFPSNSSGGFPYLFTGINKGASARRSLIRFDLSTAIPAGATVTSASLHLYLEFGRNQPTFVKMHRVSSNWGEGNNPLVDLSTVGQGAPAQNGDATWLHQFYPNLTWLNPGGNYTATASATTGMANYGAWVVFHAANMTSDINHWLTFPAQNHGWILIGGEIGFQNANRFHSSEAPDNRPRLFIDVQQNSTITDWMVY